MVSTFSKTTTGTAKGGTAGDYDSLPDIDLQDGTKELLALLVLAIPTKNTTAEGTAPVIEFSSDELGIGKQYFDVCGVQQGGPTTNNQPFPVYADLIPLELKTKGGEAISLGLSASKPDPTEAFDVVVAALQADGSIPKTLRDCLRSWPSKMPGHGGQRQDNNDLSVTGLTILSTTPMKVPTWAQAITGVKPYPIQDVVPAASEAVVGRIELRSTQSKFSPQEFPHVIGMYPGLGTSVVGCGWPMVPEWPVWIPNVSKKTQQVDAYSALLVAVTGAIAVACKIRFIGKARQVA